MYELNFKSWACIILTGIVRWLVGAEQPLGENEPTIFKPYRVEGCIDEREDEYGRKYYDGCVYVRKKK